MGLKKDEQRKNKYIHRIVAEHFIPNPGKLPEINHKDGNKQNNHFLNLEWITSSDNKIHSYDTGLDINIGKNHWNNKLNEIEVQMIRELLKTKKFTQKELSEVFEISQEVIQGISINKYWKRLDEREPVKRHTVNEMFPLIEKGMSNIEISKYKNISPSLAGYYRRKYKQELKTIGVL